MDKGWFNTEGRPGDRTLSQQLIGIVPVLHSVQNKRVLDIGCAEGLISLAVSDAGAESVLGVEIVEQHLKVARGLVGSRNVKFVQADANDYQPPHEFDVVLMLAILHKLRNPYEACRRFAQAATELCVLRLPPKHAPKIIDARSNSVPHDMNAAMIAEGFRLSEVTDGPYGEWVGYFRR